MRFLLILICASWVGCQKPAPKAPPSELSASLEADHCQVTMEVAGMMCIQNCANAVAKALQGVEGVVEVAVDFPEKRADVLGKATVCEDEAVKKLPQVVIDAGYKAKIVKVEHGG